MNCLQVLSLNTTVSMISLWNEDHSLLFLWCGNEGYHQERSEHLMTYRVNIKLLYSIGAGYVEELLLHSETSNRGRNQLWLIQLIMAGPSGDSHVHLSSI